MNNEWVEFSGGDALSRSRKARVLLTEKKLFRLNRVAIELLGSPGTVKLLYDAGQNRIGIRKCEADSPNIFHVFKERNGHASVIRAAPFCNYYAIKPEHTVEFDPIRQDTDGTLVLDLGKARRLG